MTGEGEPFDHWRAWLETIQRDIRRMHWARTIWRNCIEVAQSNAALQERGTFATWATSNYASAQVMAVRRQGDAGSDAVSLRRLLEELARNRKPSRKRGSSE